MSTAEMMNPGSAFSSRCASELAASPVRRYVAPLETVISIDMWPGVCPGVRQQTTVPSPNRSQPSSASSSITQSIPGFV